MGLTASGRSDHGEPVPVDIDPAIMEFHRSQRGQEHRRDHDRSEQEVPVYGLSNNLSSDFRDLEAGYNNGDAHRIRTMNTYRYRVAKYIGSYVAVMNGVDVDLALPQVSARTHL